MLMEIFVFTFVIAILFYRWATKNNDYFKRRGIPYDKPVFLLGSGKDMILRRKSPLDAIAELYNRFDGKIFGAFDNRDPVLVIRDPDLIKRITITDFDHFKNRRRLFDESNPSVINHTLFSMQNEKWRDMRCTLTPAFTGNRMRQMCGLMLEAVNEAMCYMREQLQQVTAGDDFDINVKDYTSRLTNDIIASTAFGIKVNSFRERDHEFYVKARKAMDFSTLQFVKAVFMTILPKVAEKLNMDFFDNEYMTYFNRLILDAMKYRQENNIHRPDMINLLMEARGLIPTELHRMHFREWADHEMVAQCFLFFVAGFETSASFMSFATHELMEYPDVQQKLFEEINAVSEKLEGESITYDLLQEMRYMDMVTSEVLRKWPVALITERVCAQDYVYEDEDGERIEILKGEVLRLPVVAIQRDPKYFKNPEVLDPERFSAQNKDKIQVGTYLPFGLGPRNCIGSRFALLEAKAFLYYLVRDYHIEASTKSTIPMELDTKAFALQPKTGFWVKLRPRI